MKEATKNLEGVQGVIKVTKLKCLVIELHTICSEL